MVDNQDNEDLDPVDRADIDQALTVINDPDQFIKRIFIHQLNIVSSLAKVNPEIWQGVMGLANEFQMTKLVLLRRETIKTKDSQSPEIRLLLDLALVLSKYVNAQHVKQTKIAEAIKQAKDNQGSDSQTEIQLAQPNLVDISETQGLSDRLDQLRRRYAIEQGKKKSSVVSFIDNLAIIARQKVIKRLSKRKKVAKSEAEVDDQEKKNKIKKPLSLTLLDKVQKATKKYFIGKGKNTLTNFLGTLNTAAKDENYETVHLYEQIAEVAKEYGVLIIPPYEESTVETDSHNQKDAELRLGIIDTQSQKWQYLATAMLPMV